MQLLQLIERCDSKGSRRRLQKRLDLVIEPQISAVETALAVCQRIGRCFHLSQIIIGSLMQLADQIQIVIQHLKERLSFLLRFCIDHRKMQTDGSNIESSHKYRCIFFISRLHAASFIPWRKECAASHRTDDFSIFFINTRNISVPCQAQPIRIHGLSGTLDSRFEHIFQRFSRTMQVLVVQKYDFREQHRFFVSVFSLSVLSHFQHLDRCQLSINAGTGSGCHCNKRIVSAAGGYGIELIFPSLESLLHLLFQICPCHFLHGLFIQTQPSVLFDQLFMRFFCIRF